MKRFNFFFIPTKNKCDKTTVNSTVKTMCLVYVYVFEPRQSYDNTRVELDGATSKAGLVCHIQRHS